MVALAIIGGIAIAGVVFVLLGLAFLGSLKPGDVP